MPDLNRLQKGMKSIEDLCKCHDACLILQHVAECVAESACECVTECYADAFNELVKQLQPLRELIQSQVDLQAASDRHEYLMRADVSRELRELKLKMDACMQSVEN